ncbi:SMP-30/gluconolactonase/LRE family protein [Nonomuraea sp. K274]|uniref:SMP-30/gluconolactonase/LRE family protein n=1 Tax=Nonomuraea cypriaca TaxID=1187855 RepID=A0A931F123_9ACTN|nr:SMP-30/gluconolactonase/LRE family protein [Nonomuraea cypriaca]MBF8186983.1 SMP-30/gluconolactonase/LRE family protein [Nonomuraea cypriaca]
MSWFGPCSTLGECPRWDAATSTLTWVETRLFAEIPPPGRPDGMAVDTEGNVWSAIAGGGHVACFSPAGTELHREPIPVPTPTSCCFAGPDRDRLIVTTSRKRMSPTALAAHPGSGHTWDAGRVGATGTPQLPFAGTLSSP